MTTITTPSSLALVPSLKTAWQDVDSSFERFCLTAGIGAIEQMLCEDAQQLAGTPHNRGGGMVVGLSCIVRGCAVTTAMKLRCRLGRRHRPRTGLAAGP